MVFFKESYSFVQETHSICQDQYGWAVRSCPF